MNSTLIVLSGILAYIVIMTLLNVIRLISAGSLISGLMRGFTAQPQESQHKQVSELSQLPTYAPSESHVITYSQRAGRCIVYDNQLPIGELLIVGNEDATILSNDGRTLFIDKNDNQLPLNQFKNQVIKNYNQFLKSMD